MGCLSLILLTALSKHSFSPLTISPFSSSFFRSSYSSRTGKREYLRAINSAVTGLSKTRGQKLTFLKDYEFNPANIHFESLTLNPSPTAILNILCKQFLHANVSAILYMMNYEQYGRSTASAQYFLQVIFLSKTNFKFLSTLDSILNKFQLARWIFGNSCD